MADETILLDEATRRKFDQLMLTASKVRAGAIKGERRSNKRGTSIEFADYRNYAPGDDLRRLDWNVYARLERPYVKLYEDEEDLAVHVILDASASMDYPTDESEPTHHKFLFARRLFAGLAYIALINNDRVMLTVLHSGEMEHFGPSRGRSQTVAMLKYAHSLKPNGVTDLNIALKDYATRANRPGLTIVISDMFSASGYLDGLNALLGRGHEVVLLHVLAPEEITPPLTGDLRLIDVESGQAQEVSLDAGIRDLYMQRLESWCDEIRRECSRRGVHYLTLEAGALWEKTILYDLRRIGVVR